MRVVRSYVKKMKVADMPPIQSPVDRALAVKLVTD